MARDDGWASRLNQRVVIEAPTRDVDELGGGDISWETLTELWAEILPINQFREREQAGQVAASTSYRVRLRKRTDIDATMRIQWNGHVLLIHSLHEQDAILELLTYEEAL
jgi:SPP1 family predicted phage head-tail adaptor